MNIFLVDDNNQFRKAMKVYLNQVLNHNIIGEATDGLEFLVNYKYNSDIVLIDLNMPEMDGYTAIKKAYAKDTRINAIAITMYKEKAYLRKLIENGFKGCVYKSDVYKKLPLALEEVSKGNLFFPDDLNVE